MNTETATQNFALVSSHGVAYGVYPTRDAVDAAAQAKGWRQWTTIPTTRACWTL